MGTVTTLPAFLDAFRDALAARSVFMTTPVAVYSAIYPDDKALGRDFLLLGCTQDGPAPVGNQYEYRIGTPMLVVAESYDVPCHLKTAADGAGESGIKAARDRAFAVLADAHSYLSANDTVGGVVTDARISGYTSRELIDPDGRARVVVIDFTIAVQAKFTPA